MATTTDKQTHMRSLFLKTGLLAACACGLLTGCATPKPMPQAYLEQKHEMKVEITRYPKKPVMRDSAQGGLIGVLVNAGRSSKMKEKMAGIQGETVKELIRQSVTKRIEEKFPITDNDNDLRCEIMIQQFGWFVPSTVLGIKTGSYQFEIIGSVTVFDMQQKKKKIAFLASGINRPLGNQPDETLVQQALLNAVKDFSDQTVDYLLTGKLPKRK